MMSNLVFEDGTGTLDTFEQLSPEKIGGGGALLVPPTGVEVENPKP
jgi:hypothetical protein